jgi:hexosaminidase
LNVYEHIETEWEPPIVLDNLHDIANLQPATNSMRNFKQYAAIATGFINVLDDNVYFFFSNNKEVWINEKCIINNRGEVKLFSRNDSSIALKKGWHKFKVVFLGHIIGGYPSNWNHGDVLIRCFNSNEFIQIRLENIAHNTEN